MAKRYDTDVAIVGAGPVGAMLAKLCGVHGLTAMAFDRETDVYDLPRAAGMYDDVQRILDNAGVLEAVRPATDVMTGAEFIDASGKQIMGIEMPPGMLTANGYPPLLNIHQPGVERAIRSCLAEHSGVQLRLGYDVVRIRQDADGVEIDVHDPADGCDRTVRARWLVGCDGAASSVRKSCGIAWSSLGYDHEWLVVDVEMKRDVELPRLCQQLCDPERPTTLLPLPGDVRRWEFQLRAGETREEMERPARVWELLEPWIAPADGEILRAVVYRFHATIADTFRDGRVFLAGDAAHQTPPFMGQGLCSGVRDVENLAWKLAMVARGKAGDALLDTYSAERHPLAVAMVELSTNTGKLIDAYAGMARGGPEPSAEMQAYAYGGGATLPDLSDGLLATEGGEWVGQLAPQAEVVTAQAAGRLDDVVGPRWAVISKDDPRELIDAEAARFWAGLDAVMVSVPQPDGAMLGLLLHHQIVAVRPDRIIYGVDASVSCTEALHGLLALLDATGARVARGSVAPASG